MSGSLSSEEIAQERSALARRRRASLSLVLSLLAFISFTFVAPIATMLYRSIYNPDVVQLIPETVAELSQWDRDGPPLLSPMIVPLIIAAAGRALPRVPSSPS